MFLDWRWLLETGGLNTLQWRHNGCDGVSNHQLHGRLLNLYTDQRKHQSSASLAFAWGIHRWPVNSPHKGPVTRKMFPFDEVIMKLAHILQTMMKCIVLKASVYVLMKILYATIYHSEEKRAHIYSERYIMRYGAGTLWELWDWSVGLPTFGCLPSLMGTCGDFLFNNPSTISRCPVWKCLVSGNAIKINNSSTNLTHFFHLWKLVVILTLQLKLQIKFMSIYCVIALRRVPLTNFDAKSTVVRVMAWCRLATRHYLGKCCTDICRHMASLGHDGLVPEHLPKDLMANFPYTAFAGTLRSIYWCRLTLNTPVNPVSISAGNRLCPVELCQSWSIVDFTLNVKLRCKVNQIMIIYFIKI